MKKEHQLIRAARDGNLNQLKEQIANKAESWTNKAGPQEVNNGFQMFPIHVGWGSTFFLGVQLQLVPSCSFHLWHAACGACRGETVLRATPPRRSRLRRWVGRSRVVLSVPFGGSEVDARTKRMWSVEAWLG